MNMADENKDIEVNPLFLGLVLSLEASAMQSLGKTMTPGSGKIERDLRQAQITIDIMDMLEKKTAGNLTEEEQKILRRVLYQARMNYLDEFNAEKNQPNETSAAQAGPKSADNK